MGFFKRHKGRSSYDLLSNYSHFTPGIMELIWIVLFMLLGVFIGSAVLQAFVMCGYAQAVLKYGVLIAYPLMFIPAMLYASAVSRRNDGFEVGYALDNNNFGTHRGFTMAFAAFAMSIATAIVIEPVNMLMPDMSAEMMQKMEALIGGPVWVTFISVSIFAPFFEEWLCRGIVLRGLLKKVSPAWAVVISAAFFALIHMNLWQAVPAFLMGLVFGYVYYKTGSLKLTMLMHCVNNTMAALLSRVPSLKDVDSIVDVMSPWTYASIFICCAAFLVSTVVVLMNMPRK